MKRLFLQIANYLDDFLINFLHLNEGGEIKPVNIKVSDNGIYIQSCDFFRHTPYLEDMKTFMQQSLKKTKVQDKEKFGQALGKCLGTDLTLSFNDENQNQSPS